MDGIFETFITTTSYIINNLTIVYDNILGTIINHELTNSDI
jgi:hypothetical protein